MAATTVQRKSKGRRQRRGMSEINVTPFVDVMLVLLIVFMVTAPLLTTGVSVDLPQAKSSPLPGQDEPLSVTVEANGFVHIQDSTIEPSQLAARLDAITQENKETRIFVRGDQAANYGQVMAVIGAIHAAGFSRVSLVTSNTANSRAAS